MKHWKKLTILLSLAAVLFGAVACASSGSETAEPEAAATGKLEVHDVWGRSSPMAAQNGAFYMKLANHSAEDDSLLEARTDVCQTAELHEMYMKENDVMGMRPVEGGQIDVPAGETVELKTGGLHVMCLGKTAAFNVGDSYSITLVFANAGEMEVTADIRESEAMGNMDMDHGDGEMAGMDDDHGSAGSKTVPNNGAEVHITSPADGATFKASDNVPVVIETTNFTIGENGNHWHIYQDGNPIMVMGGNTFVLQHLSPGHHEIEVFLSLGTHEDLEDGDKIMITVEE